RRGRACRPDAASAPGTADRKAARRRRASRHAPCPRAHSRRTRARSAASPCSAATPACAARRSSPRAP
ncbi:LuxR family transcriptional regulator, partial [Burkholderia multivorans]